MPNLTRPLSGGVAVALAAVLSGCFLFGSSITPAQKQCLRQNSAAAPDLTGRWASSKGDVALDLRRGAYPQNLEFASASGALGYTMGGRLEIPQTEADGVTCASRYHVILVRTHPVPRGATGVPRRETLRGVVSPDTTTISFGSETWRRVGAVGKLEPPGPGESKYNTSLTGTVLKATRSRPDACKAACEKTTKCVAFVTVNNTECKLLSTVGQAKRLLGASATVLAKKKTAGGAATRPVPAPGVMASRVKLAGTVLRSTNVGARSARAKCQRACDDDWTCLAFNVEPFAGTCQLLKSVTSATRDPKWDARLIPARVARAPGPGRSEVDTRLSGKTYKTLRIQPREKGRDCRAACAKDDRCYGVTYSSAGETCELVGKGLGTPRPEKGWTSWAAPLRPPNPSVPPDQRMTSHLCKDHGPTWPARILSPDGVFAEDTPNPVGHIDIENLLKPASVPKRPHLVQARQPNRVDWTKAFWVRPLPNGNVHFHSWYKADLVLSRDAEGEVVVSEANASSEWRIEALWEYVDPYPMYRGGVWYVIRDAETGLYLSHEGSRLTFTGNPEDKRAHWTFSTLSLPGEKGAFVELSVQEVPPIVLDERVVNALTKWAVDELVRQEQPSCWKKGGSGPCPAGQDTNCGLFCAQSTEMCVLEVSEMVQSVTDVAANIAGLVFTGGTANAALKTARVAQKGAKLAMRQVMRSAGRKLRQRMKKRVAPRIARFIKSRGKSEKFKKLARAVAIEQGKRLGKFTAKQLKDRTGRDVNAYVEQQSARATEMVADAYAEEVAKRVGEIMGARAAAGTDPDLLEIVALVDPTGVAAVVEAFNKPECEEIPMPDIRTL